MSEQRMTADPDEFDQRNFDTLSAVIDSADPAALDQLSHDCRSLEAENAALRAQVEAARTALLAVRSLAAEDHVCLFGICNACGHAPEHSERCPMPLVNAALQPQTEES